MSRQIVLDTETTGLEVSDGHRIIEIGAVELVDRRLTGNNYHQYINPEREIDAGAVEIHGITSEFLADKPFFNQVAQDFVSYMEGADELIIHNAPFDVGFLNAELDRAGLKLKIANMCKVSDSLALARSKYPGKRNSLDALCDRLEINNSHRTLHGALLDSEILADVFLLLTGGQEHMSFDEPEALSSDSAGTSTVSRGSFTVTKPSRNELEEHLKWCEQHKVAAW